MNQSMYADLYARSNKQKNHFIKSYANNSHHVECDNTRSVYELKKIKRLHYIYILFLFCFRTTVVPMNASCSLHGDGKGTKHKIGSSKSTNNLLIVLWALFNCIDETMS